MSCTSISKLTRQWPTGLNGTVLYTQSWGDWPKVNTDGADFLTHTGTRVNYGVQQLQSPCLPSLQIVHSYLVAIVERSRCFPKPPINNTNHPSGHHHASLKNACQDVANNIIDSLAPTDREASVWQWRRKLSSAHPPCWIHTVHLVHGEKMMTRHVTVTITNMLDLLPEKTALCSTRMT